MSHSLHGLHILVTRPIAQAEPWAKQLEALGAQVTVQPMLSIEPLQEAQDKQQIINRVLAFAEYQKAIFVSQNAVQYGLQWLDQYWPQLPIEVEFFAIGQATAALLNESVDVGMVYCATEAMNSESLLAHPQLQSIDGEKIIIFRGKGGRTVLADTLTARGAQVDYCALYERVAPTLTLEPSALGLKPSASPSKSSTAQPINTDYRHTHKPAIVAVHSGETLSNLCAIITPADLLWLQQQTIVVPGQRVADLAHKAQFVNVIVAKNASHESMVSAIAEWNIHQTQSTEKGMSNT